MEDLQEFFTTLFEQFQDKNARQKGAGDSRCKIEATFRDDPRLQRPKIQPPSRDDLHETAKQAGK